MILIIVSGTGFSCQMVCVWVMRAGCFRLCCLPDGDIRATHCMKLSTTDKILAFICLVWGILTLLSGFIFTHLSTSWLVPYGVTASFHPQWSIISFIPVLVFQYLWIRKCHDDDKDPGTRDFLVRRYIIIIGLFAAILTGAAIHMGFLPLFFHQLISWPLVLFVIWDALQILFRRD